MKYICYAVLLFISQLSFSQIDASEFQLKDGSDISSFLSNYIKIKSYSGEEVKAGEFIRKACRENGLHITQMGSKNGNFNFAASLYPLSQGKPNIILLNHIDVVHEGNASEWIFPPFSGKTVDGDIWGRGAYDNKGLAAMQLFSLLHFSNLNNQQELPYNITLLSVSCEETNCKGGAAFVVNKYLDILQPAVVMGEGAPGLNQLLKSDPSKFLFGISIAHKRALWLKLEHSVSVSGHGSVTPARYSNKEMILALNRLIKKEQPFVITKINSQILKDIAEHEKGITGFVMKHPRVFRFLLKSQIKKSPEMFAIFSNTVTLTNIENHNTVFNKIPEKAIAYLDCRLLPGINEDKFIAYIKKKLNNPDIKITIANSMPTMQISSTETTFYNSLKNVLAENHPEGAILPIIIPNYNDCGVFRSKGIEAYSSNLFEIDRHYMHTIHNTNERIPVKSLKQGTNIYFDFLNEVQFKSNEY